MASQNDYQNRIFADRYARKDTTSEVEVGDDVVVSVKRRFSKDGEEIESRELGNVIKQTSEGDNPTFHVVLKDPGKPLEEREVIHDVERSKIEVLLEKTYEDVCARISLAVAAKDSKPNFQQDVFDLMIERKLMPAGRILAGLGCEDRTLTFFNCYVFPPPKDSRAGISEHWRKLFDTFSIGGGVGWDNSSHRPRGSVVRKVNGRSSGAVSWMEQYSQITGAVEQGGSRRGASLMSLWIWHPDVIELIGAKAEREEFKVGNQMISRNKGLLENANVSILISDDFMRAVKEDDEWNLVFPDTNHPQYDDKWDGDLQKWTDAGLPVKIYKTVRAKELWEKIIDQAWASGEPGLIFMERMQKMSNSYYFNKISCTNPCGEQPLAPGSVCNLGHINLSRFVKSTKLPRTSVAAEEAMRNFDEEGLVKAINVGVRFLDNVTDLNHYHDPQIEARQKSERRVGLGLLGYGELLVRLGLRYGSKEAIKFTDWMMTKFAEASYLASSNLAKERGPFKDFKAQKYLASGFMKQLCRELPGLGRIIEDQGMRNVTVNTVAPTGSVGTMLGTTTGIEPYFLPSWVARSRIGSADEEANILKEIREQFGDEIPEYFVTTQDITPRQHVETQATFQKWIDASISKTVNLPNSATKDDVARAYLDMYEMGCKGGTVYRDGSRDRQVLYYKTEEEEQEIPETIPVEIIDRYKTSSPGELRPKIEEGLSVTITVGTPVGKLHGTCRFHPVTGEPYDVFLNSGKGDVSADTQAIGRLVSVILRWPDGETIPQMQRMAIIADQLYRIPGRSQAGIGPGNKTISLPDGVSQLLTKIQEGDFPMSDIPFGEAQREAFIKSLPKTCNCGGGGGHGTGADLSNPFDEEDAFADNNETDLDIIGAAKDICPNCGDMGWVDIPNHCPYCTKCSWTEC